MGRPRAGINVFGTSEVPRNDHLVGNLEDVVPLSRRSVLLLFPHAPLDPDEGDIVRTAHIGEPRVHPRAVEDHGSRRALLDELTEIGAEDPVPAVWTFLRCVARGKIVHGQTWRPHLLVGPGQSEQFVAIAVRQLLGDSKQARDMPQPCPVARHEEHIDLIGWLDMEGSCYSRDLDLSKGIFDSGQGSFLALHLASLLCLCRGDLRGEGTTRLLLVVLALLALL